MLKHCLARALRNIKHEARGRHANKAQGKAECFISIEAACRVLYSAHEQGNAFTILKNFQRNDSIKCVCQFTVTYKFNSYT